MPFYQSRPSNLIFSSINPAPAPKKKRPRAQPEGAGMEFVDRHLARARDFGEVSARRRRRRRRLTTKATNPSVIPRSSSTPVRRREVCDVHVAPHRVGENSISLFFPLGDHFFFFLLSINLVAVEKIKHSNTRARLSARSIRRQ